MATWASGDSLTPATLNLKMSSAVTSAGFSSNTLASESGNTIFVQDQIDLVDTQASLSELKLYSVSGYPEALLFSASTLPAFAGVFATSRARTSLSAPSGISSGDVIGWAFNMSGYHSGVGASYRAGVQGLGVAAEDWTATERGSFFDVRTIPQADTSLTTMARFGPHTGISVRDGLATRPGMGFLSEASLGWYRSSASEMALSYGTLIVPSGVSAGGNLTVMGATALFGADGPSVGFRNNAIVEFRTEGTGFMAFNADSSNSVLRIQDRITGGSPILGYYKSGMGFAAGSDSVAVPSAATYGFFYIPSSSTTGPVATPTTAPGSQVPMVFETQHNRLWAFYGGSWHFAAFT